VGTVRAVPEDVLQADLIKLRVLAVQGNADAECMLGERYRTGKGVPQDDKAAAEWWHVIGC
jgi:TPR repeat protein